MDLGDAKTIAGMELLIKIKTETLASLLLVHLDFGVFGVE